MNLETVTSTVSLDDGSKIDCVIITDSPHPVVLLDEGEALSLGEAQIQLFEDGTYEYQLPAEYRLQPIDGVITIHKTAKHAGHITPHRYVGTISTEIQDTGTGKKRGLLSLEVRSAKTDYRTDYRFMLEDIAARCADLILQYSSPALQKLIPDTQQPAETIYQRFAFVKSILESPDFTESVYRIRENPNTQWTQQESQQKLNKPQRRTNNSVRQMARASNRIGLDPGHPLYPDLPSLPAAISTAAKIETVDTPENRFIKYVLREFLSFVNDTRNKFKPDSRAHREALRLESVLENMLEHSFFKMISGPSLQALNSPVLQRREGYREVLRAWLLFDLTARLHWTGGTDVYEAGKRDVATLYEYWVFFVLLELYGRVFTIDPVSIRNLLGPTKDGLGLLIKKGKRTSIKGQFTSTGRKLQVEFSFNRRFGGKKEYPNGGSWTAGMTPDYTLSIWPQEMAMEQAEREELIVHLHFDAKYKIEREKPTVGEEETHYGNHKREDLLKMHSYRDAIRRTAGAYILYPGKHGFQQSIFHELLPGIGAFRLHPSRENSGIPELESFLRSAVDHLLDYASQREELALRTFEIHRQKDRHPIKTSLPGWDTLIRRQPPAAIKILVGYCKSTEHDDWISTNRQYNIRTGHGEDILALTAENLGVRFILLHRENQLVTGDLRAIADTPPRVVTKAELKAKNYPKPAHSSYLVFDILADPLANFANISWDVRKLPGYREGRASAIPFIVSLADLMRAGIPNTV
ncbi:DUF2357 domain-containing protein [Puia sp.]|jgi:hypothetical protein|uniref:DUF2357 domain-containing protein n=1 Tax=Puia sp. TaxID=2045100 RepID=UPI002F3ED447